MVLILLIIVAFVLAKTGTISKDFFASLVVNSLIFTIILRGIFNPFFWIIMFFVLMYSKELEKSNYLKDIYYQAYNFIKSLI